MPFQELSPDLLKHEEMSYAASVLQHTVSESTTKLDRSVHCDCAAALCASILQARSLRISMSSGTGRGFLHAWAQ